MRELFSRSLSRVVLCGIGITLAMFAQAAPGNPATKPVAATSRPGAVSYMKEVWTPLGSEYNTVLSSKTWRVMDDNDTLLFTRIIRYENDYALDELKRCNADLCVRALSLTPLKQTVVILDKKGTEIASVLTEPLSDIHIADKSKILLIYGYHVEADGLNTALNKAVAYSMPSGKRLNGDLSTFASLVFKPISRVEWPQFYVISSGDYREKDNPLKLIEYDKDLKQTFSHAVSRRNQRLEFVCTDKDTIYMATTTPEGRWDFMYFEVKDRKLSDAPFPIPKSTWLNALPFGDGKLVIWGEQGLTLFEPRMALRKRAPIIQLPPSPSRSFPEAFTLLREPGSVADDGRFALVVQHRSKKPNDVLVYSKEGKLLEQIEMKEGFIEHLKFLSGSNEVLVFAREYTARVKLNPPPTTAPSTQPTTVPREPSQQVK